MLMIVQKQRYEGDCVTTALSMFLTLPYEDVAIAVKEVIGEKRRRGRQGMWIAETIRVATHLNRPLRRKRKFDFDTHEGILVVRSQYAGHALVLRRGLIFDPAEAAVWDPESYFTHRDDYTPHTLLIEGTP